MNDNITPKFSINLGIVISANPYTHIYGVMPLWKMLQKKPFILAVPIGLMGNNRNGVQVQQAYNYGDHVILLYQEEYLSTGGASLCYILGSVIPEIFVGKKLSDYVPTTFWDKDNLTVQDFPGFELVEKTIKLSPYTLSATGHGSSDMLPGDFEAAGERVSLMVGDYLAGIVGRGAELFVDSINRRVVDRGLLKTSTTAASLADTAIVELPDALNATILTNKTRGSLPTPVPGKKNTAQTEYRVIEQESDLLYGRHSAVFSEDGKTPLSEDYTGYDGTRNIYAAGKLRIGKLSGLRTVTYTGPRINSLDSEPKLDPDDKVNPIQAQGLKSPDWSICSGTTDLIDNWYPASFLEANLYEYPDPEYTQLQDSVLSDKIKIAPNNSYIEFTDDGGIKIIDAWGSYILLSHGNVEIHAMNNLFMVSARDMLSFAGANKTDYATCSVSTQAYSGEYRITAGSSLRMLSGMSDKSPLILESPTAVRIIAKDLYTDANSVLFTIRNSDTSLSGGFAFQVLAPQGQINLAGQQLNFNGGKVGITSNTCAITLTNGVAIAGSINVHGGIICDRSSMTVDVINEKGAAVAKPFEFSGIVDIVNMAGGLRVSGDITTTRQLIAGSSVIGGSFSKFVGTQDKITSVGESFIAETRRFSTLTIQNLKISNASDVTTSLSPAKLENYRFTFGPASNSCVFTIPHKMPTGNLSTIQNKGFDRNGTKQYIYPGKGFWEGTGLRDPEGKLSGFVKLANAPSNTKD